jgi:hypothetical protein
VDICIRCWETLMGSLECAGSLFWSYEDVRSSLESSVTYRDYGSNYRGGLHSYMELRWTSFESHVTRRE